MENEILDLIVRWTKAEISARFVPEGNEHFQIKLDLEDEIREKCFGSSDLQALGIHFGLLSNRVLADKTATFILAIEREKITNRNSNVPAVKKNSSTFF